MAIGKFTNYRMVAGLAGGSSAFRLMVILVTWVLLAAPSADAANSTAPIRIVVYGDSGVAGKGVSENESYPVHLDAMLRQKRYNVRVINEGGNGRTSSDAIANLRSAISSNTQIVILQFGVNDIKRGIGVDRVRANMSRVIDQLKTRGIGILVVSYPSVDLCGIAASHQVPCVMWGGLPDSKYHVPNDPTRHFNGAGLRIMAARMLPAIEKLIAEERNQSDKT
jgi:acyl-CoA thioesterase-1